PRAGRRRGCGAARRKARGRRPRARRFAYSRAQLRARAARRRGLPLARRPSLRDRARHCGAARRQPFGGSLSLFGGGAVSPVPAAVLLASLAVAALVADSIWAVGAITVVLLVPCLRSPQRKVYL